MEKGASTTQMGVLSLLRIAIGWHFLSEGLGKLLDGGWTARDYLATADGPLAGVFRWMAETPVVLSAVDLLNVWGQVAIGLGLMLGLFTQTACVAGAALLAFYYVARPPAFLVSPILVEMLALVGLATVPTGRAFGLDRLLARRRRVKEAEAEPRQAVEGPAEDRPPGSPLTDRRDLLKGLSGVPFVAALGAVAGARSVWLSNEERDLVDAFSGASRKPLALTSLSDLKGQIPSGTIRGKQISRIILGGNIICGFAHSRDLIYVSSLVRAYHTPEKIFESLMLAEKCGINTILTHPSIADAINLYWKRYGGKIQFLADCGWMEGTDTLGAIDYAIDKGASICYLQGEVADKLVEEGSWDYIHRCIERVRQAGLPMGVGAHRIETLRAIAEKGISPDFWMKTFHPDSYWSHRHPEEHDNKYCYNAAETVAFMNEREEPWIAFKVMAAGSVPPREAFQYAFQSGADYICAGMYDFQMVEDANIALEVLPRTQERPRRWSV
jgi:uncharacterized membrane protein YphA (DoxX/SURF4 family)